MERSNHKVFSSQTGIMSYEVSGSGRPILVIHGSGGGSDQGILIAERLLPLGKALCPSRFGYLDSALPKKADSEAQADAYLDLLREENVRTVDVVAYSAGGPSAVEFARRYPDYCRSLILISAVSTPSLEKGLKAKLAFSQLKDRTVISGFLHSLGVPKEISPQPKEEDEHFLQFSLRSLKQFKLRLKGYLADKNMLPLPDIAYQEISCPVLIIHAADDKVVSIDNAQYTQRLVPNSESYILPEGGHLLFTQHSKIKDRIARFWNLSKTGEA
ncbi:MAG: alpha/beta fold hydrolase [Bacillota bacterium]